MSQIIISIPEDEFYQKLETIISAKIQKFAESVRGPEQDYTVNRAAKIMRRGTRTIHKYIEQGILKTTKDGRIPESEIKKFLEKR